MPRKSKFILAGLILTAVCAALGVLLASGALIPTALWAGQHEVRGVDVSSYQGEIDWAVLAAQDIDFAYIKATEGSGHVDPCFSSNWAGASAAGLRAGAYHFLSFDSPGETQAANFIAAVTPSEGMLPPAVDLEFYGDYIRRPPSAELVRSILEPVLERLRAEYGVCPVVYATERSYALYLADGGYDCDLWIRSVRRAPALSGGVDWAFWQYTSRAVLPGYSGEERFIDLNVFRGTAGEFQSYGLPPSASEANH